MHPSRRGWRRGMLPCTGVMCLLLLLAFFLQFFLLRQLVDHHKMEQQQEQEGRQGQEQGQAGSETGGASMLRGGGGDGGDAEEKEEEERKQLASRFSDVKSITKGLVEPANFYKKMVKYFVPQNGAPITRTEEDIGRIYCMVPSLYTKGKMGKWDIILRTWGSRCDVLKFFVDPPTEHQDPFPPIYVEATTGRSAEIVVLYDMVRRINGGICSGDGIPCRHIWEKVWRSWVWIGHNDLDKAEWFLKVDDDTYLFPEFIKLFVFQKQWTWRDPHYFGHKLFQHGADETLIAGAATLFSRQTVVKIVPRYEKMHHEYGDRAKFKHGQCVDRDGATEERTSSICLREVGIVAEDTWDDQLRERTMIWAVSDALVKERLNTSSGWFFWNKPKNLGTAENCCSDTPICFHNYKDSKHLLRINELLYSTENHELKEKDGNAAFMSMLKSSPNAPERTLVRGYMQVRIGLYRQIKYFHRIRNNLELLWLSDIDEEDEKKLE